MFSVYPADYLYDIFYKKRGGEYSEKAIEQKSGNDGAEHRKLQ